MENREARRSLCCGGGPGKRHERPPQQSLRHATGQATARIQCPINKVLFIGDTSSWSVQASALTQEHFRDVLTVLWNYREEYPAQINTWESDLILSFKNDLVLTPDVLQKAKCAINFHPAPPNYRGVGGYYYAIANRDRQYGVTCHHMVERIDYGPIIQVQYFPISADEDATSLKEKAGRQCLLLLQEILPLLVTGQLPLTDQVWGNKLYTRAELTHQPTLTLFVPSPNDISRIVRTRRIGRKRLAVRDSTVLNGNSSTQP